MTIRIVTDSTADIPPELAALHGITVVPLIVLFGDEQLRDGVDITSERFFFRLAHEPKTLPTTSQPSIGAFREAYERLRDEGATEILSIHLSAKLSRTIESVRQAAEGLEGVQVTHMNSELASLGLGLGVIHAAEAAEAGKPLEEIEALVRDHFRRTHLFIMVDTLEYLRRGGRIGRAQELIGSLLQFKPLLALQDGEVVPVGRARTKARAIEELLRRAAEFRPIVEAMAVHATSPEDVEYLAQRLHGIAPDASITLGRLTPVIGVHSGPGALAFAVVAAPEASD